MDTDDLVTKRQFYETKRHPQYDAATMENDLALISVDPPFDFGGGWGCHKLTD
jgi:hypothetical protein